MYQLIDGKKLAQEIIADVGDRIARENINPQLAVILVGKDPASHLYVRLKERACKEIGIRFHKYLIGEEEDESKIIEIIRFLNRDDTIDAILIQLPLPQKFDQDRITSALDYRKDVDGFHRTNLARLLQGKKQRILPGLVFGIWKLIESTGQKNYHDKEVLIISKSKEFTLPLQIVLKSQGLCVHSALPLDPNLSELSRHADIIVTAAGKAGFITPSMVKEGVTIIDVGITTNGEKTVGDVDFPSVAPKTAFITPVPGGVGPMTVAMLMYNTFMLGKERNGHR